MVNLVAGRQVVPELIQDQMTAGRIAAEALRLLEDVDARQTMSAGLAEVAKKLASERDPMETAADWVEKARCGRSHESESGETVHAS
jgi:lipid-A-disaccharide synthase